MQMLINQIKKDYEKSGFPVTVSDYMIEKIMLPMRDGTRMRTVIYKPVGLEISGSSSPYLLSA